MKKIIILAGLFVGLISFADSQASYSSGHYSFSYPETFTGIEAVAESFNGYWSAFNEVFRFNPDILKNGNRIVILADKVSFDEYISGRIGETRNEFLFLKYSTPELSELVLYIGVSPAGSPHPFAGPALNRQLFLQYLYSFVSEPPIWVRDGFQAYFEKLIYSPQTKTVQGLSYLPWLETAKYLNADPERSLNSNEILSAVTGTFESARLYPQAWAFVSFLLNTEKVEYQRFLSEICMILEGNEGYNRVNQRENTENVKNRFMRFNTTETCDADFSFWLAGQRTFSELLQSGVSQYNAGNFPSSRDILMEAASIRPEDPMLVYYLGLVAYAEKNYAGAELWYRKALAYGADISTVNWALGLNAFADKRYAEARVYIETAKSVNPARYEDKASKLINSMPK